MSIERWDPFREMISLRDAMNSLLAESFVRPGGQPAPGGAATLPLDVAETEGEFVVKASLPGIKPEDVHITAHGDALTIRGESKAEEEKKGAHWHMRERRVSSLARSDQPGHPDPNRRGECPVRSRGLDADLAEDGGGQAEADQGAERPDTARRRAIVRCISSPEGGVVRHRQAGHCRSAAEAGREARADPRGRGRESPLGARGLQLATPWRRAGSSRRGSGPLCGEYQSFP